MSDLYHKWPDSEAIYTDLLLEIQSLFDDRDLVSEDLRDDEEVVCEEPSLEGFKESILDFIDRAVEILSRLVNRFVDFLRNVFDFSPKSAEAIDRIAIGTSKLNMATKNAEGVIESSASSVEESLSKKRDPNLDTETLKAELIANYRKPMTQKEITAFPTRTLLKNVIAQRIDNFTNDRLQRIMTPFVNDLYYQRFGMMAAGMMNDLLSDFRMKAMTYIREVNTFIIQARSGEEKAKQTIENLKSIYEACDDSAMKLLEGYIVPFGRAVVFNKGGHGLNQSSPGTAAKTLRINVNALLTFLREADDNPTSKLTYPDLEKKIDAFRQRSREFQTDHGKEIGQFIHAIKNTTSQVKNNRARMKDTIGDNEKVGKEFLKTLDHLGNFAIIAREVCRVYNGFLELSLTFVNAYADIANYKHREIQNVLDFYASEATGFKQKALSDVSRNLLSQRIGLQSFINQLKDIVKRSKDSSAPKGNYSIGDYGSR